MLSLKFAQVIRLSSQDMFTTISSVSPKVVQAFFKLIDFLICVGVGTNNAPVHHVHVQAVISASVAISTLHDTVALAFGVAVHIHCTSHCPLLVL
jgi:hypothetical protein